MRGLMTRAAWEYDGDKVVLMPNWEILLKWVDVIKIKDVNTHTHGKEKAHLEIARSHLGTTSTAHPFSPEYASKD